MKLVRKPVIMLHCYKQINFINYNSVDINKHFRSFLSNFNKRDNDACWFSLWFILIRGRGVGVRIGFISHEKFPLPHTHFNHGKNCTYFTVFRTLFLLSVSQNIIWLWLYKPLISVSFTQSHWHGAIEIN